VNALHELSIAVEVIEVVSRDAFSRGLDTIHNVTLKIGKYSEIDTHCLQSAFDVAKVDTALKDAQLFVLPENGGELEIVTYEGETGSG
jgi:Zn finger protein HypA/HybF involved in hydrogenase expression